MKRTIIRKDCADWERLRKELVTASDMPILMGDMPGLTAQDAADRKLHGIFHGKTEKQAERTRKHVQRGLDAEKELFKHFKEHVTPRVKWFDKTVLSPSKMFGATPDAIALLDGKIWTVDFKCPASETYFDRETKRSVLYNPGKYRSQVLFQAAVCWPWQKAGVHQVGGGIVYSGLWSKRNGVRKTWLSYFPAEPDYLLKIISTALEFKLALERGDFTDDVDTW